MTTNGEPNGSTEPQKVFFFDIDNCLYTKSFKIHEIMSDLIDDYFMTHLSLTREDAAHLHQRYYKDYGLAIEGLVRHHKIDPLEYNAQVDDALPLDEIIKPDLKLRKMLESIDRSNVRLWLFTNAYITHGQRVVRLLGIDDLFEGVTYCDYGAERLLCKPATEMYAKAMREAGVENKEDCYYVGSYDKVQGTSTLLTRYKTTLDSTLQLAKPAAGRLHTWSSQSQILLLSQWPTIKLRVFTSFRTSSLSCSSSNEQNTLHESRSW
jgi:pyrimidine and pyridine-specific 5'-nucleotidase